RLVDVEDELVVLEAPGGGHFRHAAQLDRAGVRAARLLVELDGAVIRVVTLLDRAVGLDPDEGIEDARPSPGVGELVEQGPVDTPRCAGGREIQDRQHDPALEQFHARSPGLSWLRPRAKLLATRHAFMTI